MNKQEFLYELKGKLWALSEEEKKSSLEYYTEMIDDRMEDGLSEEEAVAAIWETAAENVCKFAQMGGLIAPGSDAGAWAVPHGANTEHQLLANILGTNAETILSQGTATIQQKF